jgi:hypothetical protein
MYLGISFKICYNKLLNKHLTKMTNFNWDKYTSTASFEEVQQSTLRHIGCASFPAHPTMFSPCGNHLYLNSIDGDSDVNNYVRLRGFLAELYEDRYKPKYNYDYVLLQTMLKDADEYPDHLNYEFMLLLEGI